MKLEDTLEIAFTNIRQQKLRSWLTILGIVIGVAAIISLISVSLGIEHDINERTSAFGANIISISPGSQQAMRIPGGGMMGGGPPGGGFGGSDSEDSPITFREAENLRALPGVFKLDAQLSGRLEVEYKNKNTSLNVIGSEPDSFEYTVAIDPADGRLLNVNDAYSAVLGFNVAHNVFEDSDMLNKQIDIDGTVFRVVGILEESGTGDNNIYIPLKTAKELFDQHDDVDKILVYVDDDHDVATVADTLETELKYLHNLENDAADFSVSTSATASEAVSSISATLGLFLGGIASISLIVGGIGVLNTMFMSVLEQTKTIGVFKALGAKRRDIVYLFIFEAAILGLIGGAAGVGLSLVTSMILESFSVPTLITGELVFLGLVFSIVIGILAGAIPARNASSVSPIESLRYE